MKEQVLLNSAETDMTVKALKEFRTMLFQEKQSVDVIDKVLRFFDGLESNRSGIILTHYELGVVINSLTALWYRLNDKNQDTQSLDDLTLTL